MTTAVKALYDTRSRPGSRFLIPITAPAGEDDPTGWKAIARLIGIADDDGGPTDVSENHDEYLYGSKHPR